MNLFYSLAIIVCALMVFSCANNELISLDSNQGQEILEKSLAVNYPILSKYFVGQINQAFCGIASSSILINSLKNSKYVTQDSIFNISGVELISGWEDGAVTLDYVKELIQGVFKKDSKLKISIVFGDEFKNLDEFRDLLIRISSTPGKFGIVNYSRKTLGFDATPHFSPIAAFNKGKNIVYRVPVRFYVLF